MSLSWTHAICAICWYRKHPDKIPVRLKQRETERCCFCLRTTESGIYVRYNPQLLACKGEHEAKVEK